tara:strand:+ start:686 stop:1027 length:342 start_codon:yes stop_codon:yes gene_type:complete
MARTKSSRGIAPFTLRSGKSPLPVLGAIAGGVFGLKALKKKKRKERKAAKAAAAEAQGLVPGTETGVGGLGGDVMGGDALSVGGDAVGGSKADTATMIEEIHDELVGGDEGIA